MQSVSEIMQTTICRILFALNFIINSPQHFFHAFFRLLLIVDLTMQLICYCFDIGFDIFYHQCRLHYYLSVIRTPGVAKPISIFYIYSKIDILRCGYISKRTIYFKMLRYNKSLSKFPFTLFVIIVLLFC